MSFPVASTNRAYLLRIWPWPRGEDSPPCGLAVAQEILAANRGHSAVHFDSLGLFESEEAVDRSEACPGDGIRFQAYHACCAEYLLSKVAQYRPVRLLSRTKCKIPQMGLKFATLSICYVCKLGTSIQGRTVSLIVF